MNSTEEQLERLRGITIIKPGGDWSYNFMVSAWSKSFKKSLYAGVIPNHLYHSVMKEMIDGLIARGMLSLVICNKDNQDQILGFIAFEVENKYILHYIYTKYAVRGLGFAKLLTQAAKLPNNYIYTHKTRHSKPEQSFKPEYARKK